MHKLEAFQLPKDLAHPEWRLVDACRKGELADFSAVVDEVDRLIRAEVIVALMRGHRTALSALGLRTRNAVIVGKLDLTGLGSAEAPAPPLMLHDCTAQGGKGIDLVLNGGALAELDLQGTHFAELEALDLILRRRLLLSGCRSDDGVRLCFDQARIGSSVFLDEAKVKGEVRFRGAEIGGGLNIQDGAIIARADSVALYCDGIRVSQEIFLAGMTITGEVRFLGAEIRGQFDVHKTTIQAETDAFSCDRIQVGGDVFLQELTVTGQIRWPGARIDGGFSARAGTKISRSGDFALNCDGIQVKGDVFLNDLKVDGETRFLGSVIGGQFNTCEGTTLTHATGPALNCDGIQIAGDIFFDRSTVVGETRFVGAEIGGQFNVHKTAFTHADGTGLNCDGARIKSDVFLNETTVAGETRFAGADISGQFNANDRTRFNRQGGMALVCEAATVKGGVFLRGVRFNGGASFIEAEIGRLFDLHKSTLLAAVEGGGPAPAALDAAGLKVSGDLRLLGTSCDGAIRLDRARIDGALILNGATLRRSGRDSEQYALMLEQARIGTRIEVAALSASSCGVIDLRGAETGLLDDAGGTGWGRPCHWSQPSSDAGRLCGIMLRLEGFTYARLPDFEDRIREAQLPAASFGQWLSRVPGGLSAWRKDRVKAMRERFESCRHAAGRLCWWLGLCPPLEPRESTSARAQRFAFLMRQFPGTKPSQEDFAPQPFEQVVRVLRAAGHPQEADWFARKKREFRHRCGVDRFFGRLWSRFVGFFFGHYYSPKRAFATLIAAITIGAFLLLSANDSGAYVRRKTETTSATSQPQACWDSTTFQGTTLLGWPAQWLTVGGEAVITAFDLLLPVVDLKQDQRCEIDMDRHRLWATWFGLYSLLGLIILPMFIATAAGIVRREQI